MSNLIHFSDPRKIREEASLWLVRAEEGLTEDEREELATWLAADPRHAKAMTRLAEVWDAFDALSELSAVFPLDRYSSRRTVPRRVKAGAAAAVAAGIAALCWYVVVESVTQPTPDTISVALPEWRNFSNQGASVDPRVSQRSYETAVGEQLSARLPDGSVATLNTNTLLEVSYSNSERLVVIRRGEVSFNVTHDAVRPFRALARTTLVQAVGTVFNVQLDSSDRIEVTVSEGSVRVTPADRPVQSNPSLVQTQDDTSPPPAKVELTVGAGELAVIAGTEEAVRPIDALEIEAKLAWQQGMLIFRGSPLEEVLADVSRYTTVKFTIADDSIRTRRVGGYFRAGDIDALLLALRESFDIEPRRVGDEIFLTARR